MTSNTRINTKIAGLLLCCGALITMICIFCEVTSGWASFRVPLYRSDYEAGVFLSENWRVIKPIWSWALYSSLLLAIAALIWLTQPDQPGTRTYRTLWATYSIGCILIILSFSMCVGSYSHALRVLDDQPALFSTIRGTALYLFNLGTLSGLIPFIIYFYEGFHQEGIVPKSQAILMLGALIICVILISFKLVSLQFIAIVSFLIPFMLGFTYIKTAKS